MLQLRLSLLLTLLSALSLSTASPNRLASTSSTEGQRIPIQKRGVGLLTLEDGVANIDALNSLLDAPVEKFSRSALRAHQRGIDLPGFNPEHASELLGRLLTRLAAHHKQKAKRGLLEDIGVQIHHLLNGLGIKASEGSNGYTWASSLGITLPTTVAQAASSSSSSTSQAAASSTLSSTTTTTTTTKVASSSTSTVATVPSTTSKVSSSIITTTTTKPSAVSSSTASSSAASASASTVPDPDNDLTVHGSYSYWTGPLSVGTPAQTFDVIFDTGSADLWVFSDSVKDAGSHKTFDIEASSTAKKQSGTFDIEYVDGSTTNGPVYSDTVTVAGYTAVNQTFSPVTTVSSSLSTSDFDGICGLGFTLAARMDAPTFVDTLYTQGHIDENKFSFKLAESGSELYIGGVDSSAFTGELTSTPVTNGAYWMVKGDVALGGKTSVAGISAIIDSGTTLITAPPTVATQFYANISGSSKSLVYDGYMEVPCRTLNNLDLSFVFGGKAFSVPGSYLNLGLVATGSTRCVSALVAEDIGLDAWILGDVFMRAVYTVFDGTAKTISFASVV